VNNSATHLAVGSMTTPKISEAPASMTLNCNAYRSRHITFKNPSASFKLDHLAGRRASTVATFSNWKRVQKIIAFFA
jgi:hypothetical protein